MHLQPSDDLIPLTRRLASITTLSKDEMYALRGLPKTRRRFSARENILRDGDRPSQCCVILEGWAYRYKALFNGRRQILSFHTPGDIPDLQSLHLLQMDHNLGALTECVVAFIPHNAMHALIAQFPAVAAVLWRDTLVDAAIFREWITNIGQRSSIGRIAHLFCELYAKLHAAGLAHDYRCDIPLTQAEIGDAAGITPVHVNRSLQALRAQNLITYRSDHLVIHDWKALTKLAGFNPSYLHLEPKAAA